MRLLAVVTGLVVAVATGFPAYAHEAGDFILRAGPIVVTPNEDSDRIDVAGITTLPGVDVGNESQIGITGTYMFRDNIGLELLAATPFTNEIKISELGLPAGDTKQLPPTLMLQYFLGDSAAAFRSYVGIGINTTIFFEEGIANDLNLALDGIVGLPAGTVNANLDLDQSWGLSAELGFDYMLNDQRLINGSVWFTDIDTEATISTAVADVIFDVEIDPIVTMISIGYKL